MNSFNVIVAVLGGLVLLLALGSDRLARSPFPPTLLALAAGVLLGPQALGWIDVATLGHEPVIRETAARLTLGIGLVGVALRIPRDFPRRHWRPVATLTGLGMLLSWAISSGLAILILDLPFWMALLVGAIVTPTDPVAASPIVTGPLAEKHLPERLRHTISLESGVNDGLSYLFVFLALLMLTRSTENALSTWMTQTWLWDIVVATVFGLVLGYWAGRLLQWADERGTIEDDWRLIYTVALGLLAVGAGRLLGGDEVLVVFASAMSFVQVVTSEEREEEDRGQEAVNRFFSIPIFVLIGLTLPWDGWRELGLSGILFAVVLLILRRPPVVMLLQPIQSDLRSRSDALFLGWFGPIGVAALYYASLMEERLARPEVWHIVSLVICASVVAHGLTGAAGTRLYGRWQGSSEREGQKVRATA